MIHLIGRPATAPQAQASRRWCGPPVQILSGGLDALLLTGCDEWGGDQARQRLHLPPYGFDGSLAAGQALYLSHGSACHGTRGYGTTEGRPLLHPIYCSSHHPDEAFHLAVSPGVKQNHWQFGDMPPVPDLSPEEVAHVATFVRERQQLAGVYRN